MRPELVVALIGAGGAVCGAAITAFSEELKSLASGKFNRNKDLIGLWDCNWTIDQPKKEPDITDVVVVKKIAGEKLSATAETPRVGKYRLSGRISASGIATLSYGGSDDRQSLGGVVILKTNHARDELTGSWYECDRQGDFWSGATVWRKRRATG